MKFPELIAELERQFGFSNVFDQRYPELGAVRAENADFLLWAHDDIFDVGGIEKGEWASIATFSDESSACDYVLAALTRATQDMVQPSAEDNQRSKEISDSVNQALNEKFGL